MTNYRELAQNWQAVRGLAPDLLLPITDDETLMRATAALQALDKEMEASSLRPHPLEDLANMVMHKIMAYEAEHYPVPDAPGEDVLGFMMEQHRLTQQQLADATGIKQETISALLNGKRRITADHARKFADYFKVGIAAFL